jgi:hypothetical protein
MNQRCFSSSVSNGRELRKIGFQLALMDGKEDLFPFLAGAVIKEGSEVYHEDAIDDGRDDEVPIMAFPDVFGIEDGLLPETEQLLGG